MTQIARKNAVDGEKITPEFLLPVVIAYTPVLVKRILIRLLHVLK